MSMGGELDKYLKGGVQKKFTKPILLRASPDRVRAKIFRLIVAMGIYNNNQEKKFQNSKWK